MSIQAAMLVALGFLAASLLGLLVASAFWSRAVRLTTARIKQSMPVSEPEIKADRDRLRAEYAIRVHKLETQLEQAKLERARHLIEINRRDASISTLETDVGILTSGLEENQNARRVLEQTVADRLPKVEARLAEAKRLLFNRDREIAELTAGTKRTKQALEQASSIHAQQNAQIERLSTALTTRGGRASTDSRVDGEVALRTELEGLRAKTREQAMLIDRLQRRLGHGYALAAPAPVRALSAREDGDADAPSEAEADAGPSLNLEAETTRAAFEREVRSLKARTEDQAGEIARLKAALSAFEQSEGKTGILDSKIALKARLGSAQAQSEQQAATIGRLRAELAATHERLARQALVFRDEMRRIGTGTSPASGQPRRAARAGDARAGEKRSLAERVAQVRAVGSAGKTGGAGPAKARTDDAPAKTASNGDVGQPAHEANGAPEDNAAPEMPQAPEIPGEARRIRLLDRLTGQAKG